jgi:hypothetical protein
LIKIFQKKKKNKLNAKKSAGEIEEKNHLKKTNLLPSLENISAIKNTVIKGTLRREKKRRYLYFA